MSQLKTYALQAPGGHLLASFDAFNPEEAQLRASQVSEALNLGSDWRLIELTDKPRDVPLFDESYFVVLAQALHKVN